MITRRFPLIIATATTVVTTLLASSCSSISDDAARVGERTLSSEELNDLIVGYEKSTKGLEAIVEGPQDAATAHDLLSTWVASSILLDLISEAGGEVTAEALDETASMLDEQAGFADVDPKVRELFILNTAATATLARLLAPATSELAATYQQGPSASGVVCVRAILTDTKENIDLAAFRVASGESFADVAAEVSIDPSGADGGVLGGPDGNQCIDFASVVETVADEFVVALENTAIGQVSTAFEIPNVGWAILQQRDFDEVGDDVIALAGNQLATLATTDAVRTARVWIDAEYGRWDPSTGTVVALG
ncbi:MAG: PPIC-type domain [Actinomycetota bacterium]